MPIRIGIIFSVGILALVAAQLARHGSWPPFETKSDALTLGEKGDFFGGWANSLALVWLIVVTWLRYLALKVQRDELRLSQDELRLNRQELEETRAEIRRQAGAAAKQAEHAAKPAEHTAAMLGLERRRMELSYTSESEARLKFLLIDAVWLKHKFEQNERLLHVSAITLIGLVSEHLKEIITSQIPVDQRSKLVQKTAEHVRPITELFDDYEEEHTRSGTLKRSFS